MTLTRAFTRDLETEGHVMVYVTFVISACNCPIAMNLFCFVRFLGHGVWAERSQSNGICDRQTAKVRNWEIWIYEEKRARTRRSRILPIVFKFEMGWKFESSDFGRPDFFRRGEMSASLNFDEKVAWVNERFARCEMRMEKVSAQDFTSEVGM